MKNIFKITFFTALVAMFTSCDVTELELLNNPNDVTIESADASFILNDIQLSFNAIIGGYDGPSRSITRQRSQFGSYNAAVGETTLEFEWRTSYQMFANIDLLDGINEADSETDIGGIPYHVAMGQILEAYAYMLMVDYLGDVPYSEALQPELFPNPNTDPGASVYNAQLELLDAAISNLNMESARTPQDIFYGDFDTANWIALANSLKIRAYLNLRLTDQGRAASGINETMFKNIIDTEDEDFQFNYGNVDLPESRHPWYTGAYLAAGVGGYLSNGLLDFMNVGDDQPPHVETGVIDPRARYYFYRQDPAAPSGSNLPCAGDPSYDYCYVGNLYWGRDHADVAGIPNDGFKRTAIGLYPAGGAFDKDDFVQARATENNMGGEGIRPIYLSSFTNFALAEAALTIGTNGNPASLLEDGIRASMNKVEGFGNVDTGGLDMTSADINDYVGRVLSEYNQANASGKLEVIAREFYLAAWGSGIEPYNSYRRTGYPDLQAPISPSGPFPRAFQYPEEETEGNPNISPQPATTQVFWDNNPAGFID